MGSIMDQKSSIRKQRHVKFVYELVKVNNRDFDLGVEESPLLVFEVITSLRL